MSFYNNITTANKLVVFLTSYTVPPICEFLDFRSLDVPNGDKTTKSSRNVENQLSSDAGPYPGGTRTSTFDFFRHSHE